MLRKKEQRLKVYQRVRVRPLRQTLQLVQPPLGRPPLQPKQHGAVPVVVQRQQARAANVLRPATRQRLLPNVQVGARLQRVAQKQP